MFVDPADLAGNLDRLEEIEKASIRLVTQALFEFRVDAFEIYRKEKDLQADIGEDITREALDRVGVSKIDRRLFGKIDYKRARYVFHPHYAIRQALFVDSKAEKRAFSNARVQTAQTSLVIRQLTTTGAAVEEPGRVPTIYDGFLTTTIFVKYHYAAAAEPGPEVPEDDKPSSKILRERIGTELVRITVAGIPNGLLQDRYNPTAQDSIWNVGPHSPARGEKFRTRLAFAKLAAKASWRVQKVPMAPAVFVWAD